MEKRFGGFSGAANAGIIPSRSGKPSVTPKPRRTVRRGSAFLKIITAFAASSSGTAHSGRWPKLTTTNGTQERIPEQSFEWLENRNIRVGGPAHKQASFRRTRRQT